MGVFDELKKNATKVAPLVEKGIQDVEKELTRSAPQEGYIWLNVLIRFDTSGKCEIVRSFCRPAKDSAIKSIVKDKPKGPKINLEGSDGDATLF